jgi:hypothetical protein
MCVSASYAPGFSDHFRREERYPSDSGASTGREEDEDCARSNDVLAISGNV